MDNPSQLRTIKSKATRERGNRNGKTPKIRTASAIVSKIPLRRCPRKSCPAPGANAEKSAASKCRFVSEECCGGTVEVIGVASVLEDGSDIGGASPRKASGSRPYHSPWFRELFPHSYLLFASDTLSGARRPLGYGGPVRKHPRKNLVDVLELAT